MSGLSVKLLGPPAISVEGRPLAVDTRKAVALLALLSVAADPQPRGTLASMLWPENDDEHASGALRRTLSVLRSALGDRWVEPRGSLVALAGPGLDVDLAREREMWATVAGHANHGADGAAPCRTCVHALETIVGLHRGPFLSGFALRDSVEFDDWQERVAQEGERRLARALELLGAAYGAGGRFTDEMATAERLLSLDPLNESAYRQLMRLEAARGDRAGAIRRYRECVRVLDEQLSVEPLPETTDLYRAILAGDATAASRPLGARSASTAVADAPSASTAGADAPAAADATANDKLPFVGRRDAIRQLVRAWHDAARGTRVVAIEGEPGVGKTRLVEEFGAAVIGADGALATVTCYREDTRFPYATTIELLRSLSVATRFAELPDTVRREVSRLLPDLEPPRSLAREAGERPGLIPEVDEEIAHARFVEALAGAVLALAHPRDSASPPVIVVDDAQWIDAPSAELLARLPRRSSAPLLLVVSRRPIVELDPLEPLVGTNIRVVRLERLVVGDVAELLRLLGRDDDAAILLDRTEGVPLYLAESLAIEPAVAPTRAVASAGEPAISPAVRLLHDARLAPLSETARQVLGAAAVLGRSFDPALVREVSGRTDDETVAALEELSAAALVRERRPADGQAAFEFDHPRTRDLTYESLGLARRRLLHARAADALRRLPAAGPATVVARHLQRAGRDPEAARFLAEAGRDAERVFANREALELYREALALDPSRALELRARTAHLATLLGRYDEAIRDLETAIAGVAPAGADDDAECADLGRLEHLLGAVHARRGDWALADVHLAAALDVLPRSLGVERARVYLEQAVVARRRGHVSAAESLAAQALSLAEESSAGAVLAEAHNVAGMLARARGDLGAARSHLRRSLELASASNALSARVAALNNLALVERESDDVRAATELTEAALRICAQLGDRHREAALHNNLADLLQEAGRPEQARRHVRESVAILADLGEPGELNPEIWRLTEW